MDSFVLLLIVYIILLIASLILFNAKLLSPSIIFTASFSFMVFLAYIVKDMMGFEVSKTTFNVLALGGTLFVITELIVMIFFRISTYTSSNTWFITKREPLYIKKTMINMFLFIILFSFVLAVISIVLSTNGSVGRRMELYKLMMLYDTGNVEFRFLLNQLFKINTATSYLCSYIAMYNWSVCGEKMWKQRKYLLVPVVFIIYTMFSQGARQPAIESILFFVLIYFVWKLKRTDKRKVFKMVNRLVLVAPLAALIFTKTAELVGRRTAERQVLHYISAYFCGGLYAFNLHINEPARNGVWGKSSFADIYQFLNKFGVVPDEYVASYHSFELYGNTVTIFGRWYEDFGVLGVIIMTIIVAAFFSILFYKYIFPRKKTQNSHLSKILYCKLVIALVWAGYDDRIRALLSMSNLMCILLIVLFYKLFVERHFGVRLRRG